MSKKPKVEKLGCCVGEESIQRVRSSGSAIRKENWLSGMKDCTRQAKVGEDYLGKHERQVDGLLTAGRHSPPKHTHGEKGSIESGHDGFEPFSRVNLPWFTAKKKGGKSIRDKPTCRDP